MRKHIRKLLRNKAENIGAKASRYVRSEFDRLSIKKYGHDKRRIYQAKGTHTRRTWRARIAELV